MYNNNIERTDTYTSWLGVEYAAPVKTGRIGMWVFNIDGKKPAQFEYTDWLDDSGDVLRYFVEWEFDFVRTEDFTRNGIYHDALEQKPQWLDLGEFEILEWDIDW